MTPILTRLNRRRARLMQRFAMLEAADELDARGGEIALEAICDEAEFLDELYRLLVLIAMREKVLAQRPE